LLIANKDFNYLYSFFQTQSVFLIWVAKQTGAYHFLKAYTTGKEKNAKNFPGMVVFNLYF